MNEYLNKLNKGSGQKTLSEINESIDSLIKQGKKVLGNSEKENLALGEENFSFAINDFKPIYNESTLKITQDKNQITNNDKKNETYIDINFKEQEEAYLTHIYIDYLHNDFLLTKTKEYFAKFITQIEKMKNNIDIKNLENFNSEKFFQYFNIEKIKKEFIKNIYIL